LAGQETSPKQGGDKPHFRRQIAAHEQVHMDDRAGTGHHRELHEGNGAAPKVDGGTSPDGKTATADALPVGPTTPSPDTRLPEPDVAPDLQTAGLPDARPADIRVSIPDGAGTDLAPAREVGSAVDLRTQGEDTPPLVLVDARDAQGSVDLRIVSPDVSDIDTPRDLGAPDIEADARTNWDVGTSFGGVIVYVTADLTPVDSTCSAGVRPGSPRSRRPCRKPVGACSTTTACMRVSATTAATSALCPSNKYRIGEFGARVSTYSTHTCATCPEVLDILDGCSAPRAVVCRAGQCEYQ